MSPIFRGTLRDKLRLKLAFLTLIVIDQSYQTVMDVEKRKIYVRVMNEAKSRTEYEREKENAKRKKLGKN